MKMDYTAYERMAETLKTLAHPVRLCIVHGLYRQEQSRNVSELQECLDLPQSTVSQHLQKLRAAGVIEAKRHGLEMHYRLKDEAVKRWISLWFPEPPDETGNAPDPQNGQKGGQPL